MSAARFFFALARKISYPESAGVFRAGKEERVQLYPHLTFDGRCEEAFGFYEKCLHGKIAFLLRYEATPMDPPVPGVWRGKVSHATFALGENTFSGSDPLPGQYQKPQGFALQLNLSDVNEGERIFNLLAEDGSIQVPFRETFWAERFGVVMDQFHITWLVNCEKAGGQ